jgi:hypothetical protein
MTWCGEKPNLARYWRKLATEQGLLGRAEWDDLDGCC